MPTPWSMASLGEWNTTGSPSTKIWPASGRYRPARMLIRVVLPAPFSPSKACTSPQRAAKSTPRFATTPGKALSIFSIATASTSLIGTHGGYKTNRALALRNVSDDVAEGPVHLVGLDVGVVLRLRWLGRRALVEVAQRLAFGRLDSPVVVHQRPAPDVQAARPDLVLRLRRHFGDVRRHQVARLGGLNQAVLGVVVELHRLPRAVHDRLDAIDVV